MTVRVEELEVLLKEINGLLEQKATWEKERAELQGKKASIEEAICGLLGIKNFDEEYVKKAMADLEEEIEETKETVIKTKDRLRELQGQLV